MRTQTAIGRIPTLADTPTFSEALDLRECLRLADPPLALPRVQQDRFADLAADQRLQLSLCFGGHIAEGIEVGDTLTFTLQAAPDRSFHDPHPTLPCPIQEGGEGCVVTFTARAFDELDGKVCLPSGDATWDASHIRRQFVRIRVATSRDIADPPWYALQATAVPL